MAEEAQQSGEGGGIEVRTYFVRERNALLARADHGELYVDYYLHLAENGLQYAGAHDRLLKEALSALTLHCASRPRNESMAWTLNFQQPLLNLFVAGDNETGGLTGRVFAEHVRAGETNLFYADVLRGREPARRSVVEFEGRNVFRAVEKYYRQSEQRPARYFQFAEEDYVFVSAQPDCDLKWLESLTEGDIRSLDRTEELSLLESRSYRWDCGCSQRRIFELMVPAMKDNAEELFAGQESLRISCPRCGARYKFTREAMEAYLAGRENI